MSYPLELMLEAVILFNIIPLAAAACIFYLIIAKIPASPLNRCYISLVAGIVAVVLFQSMPSPDIHGDMYYGLFWLMGSSVSSALMILPPVIFMEKYLLRIPVVTAIILDVCIIVLIFWFVFNGIPGGTILNERGILLTIVSELLVSSVGCGLILGLDRMIKKYTGDRTGKPPDIPSSG